jgi:uncharacterized protein YutE (UPF0331/DUF86 family)
MVDKPTLDGLLVNLRQYVGELRRLAAVPREQFLEDPDKIGNAKYHFVIGIESCIDIANHVIASEGFRLPTDNADSFAVLVEERIIPADWKDRLASMARFRNRLVHLYSAVRDDLVCEYLQESVGDLEGFAKLIAGHQWP